MQEPTSRDQIASDLREAFNAADKADADGHPPEPPIDLIADAVHSVLMIPYQLDRIATALEKLAGNKPLI